MLGDNHLQQYHPRKSAPAWGYPGSLVQQDFGEPVCGHGFLLWDMTTAAASAQATPYHIPNDYSRFRVKLGTDGIAVKMGPLEPYVHIDTCHHTLPRMPHVSVIGDVGDDHIVRRELEKYDIHPTRISTLLLPPTASDIPVSATAAAEVSLFHNPQTWLDYLQSRGMEHSDDVSRWLFEPERIVEDCLSGSGDVPTDVQEKIKERVERIEQLIAIYRSVQEKESKFNSVNLLYLDWAWAFSYGEHNWFNFETLEHNIALLNGKNASGKSSFIDILCIALFGEPGKNRNINVAKKMSSTIIHHQKPQRAPMYCTVAFSIDGEKYLIERVYTPHKTKTDEFGIQMSKCELHKIAESDDDADWKITLIHSGATLVDAWVREHCGTINDMMESAVVSQMDIHNFFMLKPSEQKDRIDNCLNLNSLQAFGGILQQSILAYNTWIDMLGTYMQGQRASVASVDIDAATVDEHILVATERIQHLEALRMKLAVACGGATESTDEEGNTSIDIADIDISEHDVVQRRVVVKKEMDSYSQQKLLSIEEANIRAPVVATTLQHLEASQPPHTSPRVDIEEEIGDITAWLEKMRPMYDETHCAALEAQLQETEKAWLDIGSAAAEVTVEGDWASLYKSYIHLKPRKDAIMSQIKELECEMLEHKPVRDQDSYPVWQQQCSEWNALCDEAKEAEWDDVATCKRRFEKCVVSLAKWDQYVQEKETINSSISGLNKTITKDVQTLEACRKKCAKTGFKTVDDVYTYQQTSYDLTVINEELQRFQEDGWDAEWDAWSSLLQEREDNMWMTAARCKQNADALQIMEYLETCMKQDAFEPSCECCERRRSQYERDMRRAKDAQCAPLDVWRRGEFVCTEIETRTESMERKHKERTERIRALEKRRKTCLAFIKKYGDDIDFQAVQSTWIRYHTLAAEYETRHAALRDQLDKLHERVEYIDRKLATLGGDRVRIVDAVNGWKYAYEKQTVIESRREYMDAETAAWEKAQTQWEWDDALKRQYADAQQSLATASEQLEDIRTRAATALAVHRERHIQLINHMRHIISIYPEKVARLDALRDELDACDAYSAWQNEWGACTQEHELVLASLRYAQLQNEWRDIVQLQQALVHRYNACRSEISDLEIQLISLRQAQHASSVHRQVAHYEQIWQQWRETRDVLQQLRDMLISGPSATFKEWVYERHIIPMLERHINAFLTSTVATGSALRIEIEYTAKDLKFIVIDRGNRTTFGLSSGFQQFIIGLAVRLALTRIGGRGHRLQTLIIDEGFVACDADNVQYAKDILQHMMDVGGFRNILLATHLDTIKDMVSRKIPIHRDGPFSRLQVGRLMTVSPATPAEPVKRGRPKRTQ
jgi:DNA repair exonuclease SbcCD ATPase subunit